MKEDSLKNPEFIAALLLKQLQGVIADSEQQQLDAWKDANPGSRLLLETLQDEQGLADTIKAFHPENWTATNERIKAVVDAQCGATALFSKSGAVVRRMRLGWAVAILCCIAIGGYFYQQYAQKPHLAKNTGLIDTDIAPGSVGAILTLEDGTSLTLDSFNNGLVANQHGAQVLLENGQLSYTPIDNNSNKLEYNILKTPRGRQFNLQLPDGTKVWLNAASTLKYPTRFSGNERIVEITGEAYFEIARHAEKPFRLRIRNHTDVEVLGTSFNVCAYADDAHINTTLIEGSVKVGGFVLKPRQQARMQLSLSPDQLVPGNTVAASDINTLSTTPRIIHLTDEELEKVTAWKNGIFNFQHASLEEVMQQIARWYDLDVEYSGNIPTIQFGGKISRNVKLASVLQALEDSKVRFKLEGKRKLIVMP